MSRLVNLDTSFLDEPEGFWSVVIQKLWNGFLQDFIFSSHLFWEVWISKHQLQNEAF